MSALMISTIKVKDPVKLQAYLTKVRDVATKYGAEMLFRGEAAGTIRGSADHEFVVVVKFPNGEAIESLYSDVDYHPLTSLRDEAADMTIIKYVPMA